MGKSTLFNALTGMRQHTGNWPGKTVALASGSWHGRVLVDLPGTYSLLSHSPEEQVARNFLCTAGPERVVVVCDATTLERNLVLVLQILEITSRVVVCVNLMDEAKRKGLSLDLGLLSRRLGIPVASLPGKRAACAAWKRCCPETCRTACLFSYPIPRKSRGLWKKSKKPFRKALCLPAFWP